MGQLAGFENIPLPENEELEKIITYSEYKC